MGDAPKLPKGKSRSLTPGEIEMAKTVFGNSVDFSKVKIHNDTSNMFQGRNVTVTPNGEMYCANNYCDDFSKGNKGHFMHEMTHIWQYQNNVLTPRIAAAEEWVKSGFCYTKCYSYTLDTKKDLLDYNLEQQADMVADLFDAKERKAHPDPPLPPATPESVEKGFFAGAQLKALSDAHAKNPRDAMLKWATGTGNIAFDKNGQAHFTQKYADKVNEDRKKDAADQAQHDADLMVVTKKFQDNPAYARQPTFFQKAEMLAVEVAVEAVKTTGPITPFMMKR
jgi:hypothetical protein